MTITAPETAAARDRGIDPDGARLEASVTAAVEARRHELVALSHAIGEDPELAFEEHRAAERVAVALEANGFDVTRGAYGLPTAVEGVYGTGDVTVAVVSEYDALPGVGHGCGHNLIAAAGVGAAIGLRAVADELGIRVKLLGSPAEELGGGKILMLREGAWNDTTFSLMVHGGGADQYRTAPMTTMALERIIVRFTGVPAHAAAGPHEGVNAGDAATLTQVALGLLRQQLKRGTVLSSFVRNAGEAANIIPAHAELEIEMRSGNAEDWAVVRRRVRECLAGAAQATGCTLEIELPELPYGVLKQDERLAEHFDDVLRELGYEVKDLPDGPQGSTDMADVSQYLPAIHPMISIRGIDANTPGHSPEYAALARTPEADVAVIDGAIGLALAAVRVAADPEHRAELIAAQAVRGPFAWED
ncbi:amidohydrolase [Agromyces sp. CF514]|uniref:amidohydrolase n=1 Tax=Agromyces sp. CF514 TaxID=1881031 RepID=UPI0008E90223|nr:amidohydrolase [Agromyces sp. CF514]SFR90341.1 amidohydrolase [Agromyces sp. CF514]